MLLEHCIFFSLQLLYWNKFSREELFTNSRKIGAICGIKFSRKIVFWTILEKKIFDPRENEFLHLLFTYLFQLMTTILFNTT